MDPGTERSIVSTKKRLNLNDLTPDYDGLAPRRITTSVTARVDQVEIHFDGLAARLCERIREADFVVGCMAWLTNRMVLAALAESECQIVVQKEDFLRPGTVGRQELQRMYAALRSRNRFGLPGSAGSLSYASDPTCQAVRCMGIARRHQNETIPRMHHKFFVFCREEERKQEQDEYANPWGFLRPYAVWTGSFNATENAALSRENALYVESEDLANRYIDEWVRVLALSEPLDWESDYVEPEWRFGS